MRILTRILSCIVVIGLAATPLVSRAQLVSVNTITNHADTVGVFFGVPVTLPSATNLANYSVMTKTGEVSIVSIALQTNAQFVTLTLATNLGAYFYVTVSNVVDTATNTINDATLGYLSDYGSADVGTGGDPNPAGQVFTARGDTFEVIAGGSDVGGTNDGFHFLYQDAVGDFDAAVLVTQLDQADPESKAGLMARETLAADSPTIQTYFTAPGGSNEVVVGVRSTAGGMTTDSAFQVGARASATPLRYLRLTRSNDVFTAYHGADSTNGVVWTMSGVSTQIFNSTLNVGMMVAAHTTNGVPTTAKFTNFEKHSARVGDGILPTLSGSVSGTNLLLTWPVGLRPYAIEASTNLTDWAFLLLPIVEDPTNATIHSMEVPLSLSSGSLFMRLRKVDGLIPDPVTILYTGIILSPGLGLNSTALSGSLCNSIQVVSSFALAQPSGQVIAAKGTPVTITTTDCSALVDSVLQVRLPNGVTKICDDNSAGANKAVVVTATTAANLANNYSIIIAPKLNPASGYTATGILKVRVTY